MTGQQVDGSEVRGQRPEVSSWRRWTKSLSSASSSTANLSLQYRTAEFIVFHTHPTANLRPPYPGGCVHHRPRWLLRRCSTKPLCRWCVVCRRRWTPGL